jgi:predicted phage tail protein
MARKIYLNGEMSALFGQQFPFVGDTVQEALLCLQANEPKFRPYLIKCHENDIGFSIKVHGEDIDDFRECLLPLTEGDIVITPILAGSKSGGAKILTAMAIAALMFTPGGPAALMGMNTMSSATLFATGMNAGGIYAAGAMAVTSLAANLAIQGIQQIMAPDPETDREEEKGYMLSGSQKNTVEGDPVPVLYGELRVPGTPVSFEVKNKKTVLLSESYTSNGDTESITAEDNEANWGSSSNINEGAEGDSDTLNSDGPESTTTNSTRLALYGKSQDLYVTDLISEGPIQGLVNGSSSVFLNDDSAVDQGDSAVSRANTGARFNLTNNSATVTYVPNNQAAIPTSTGSRYIRIRDYKTQTSAAAIETGSALPGSAITGIKITTDSAFFPSSGTDWIWDRRNSHKSAVITLTLNGAVKFEGHIQKIDSSTIAYADPKTWNMPSDWADNTEYKVHIEYALRFSTIVGNTLTLDSVFSGTTGSYKADITGTDRDIADIQRGIGDSVKYDGFSCNFLTGQLDQIGFPDPGGTGIGSIAIPGGASSLGIGGPNSGSSTDEREYQGTSASGFNLSAEQAVEADEIRILFVYGSLINTSGNGNDHDGKAFYTIQLALNDGSSWGSYIDIHAAANPLRHMGQSKTTVSVEETIVLKDYGSFTDFKVKITRLSDDDKAYYNSFDTDPNSDYTSNTICSISSLNTILKENLSYPYTSMAKVSINTKSFTTVPKRTYHCKGMKIQVPSNYVTRDESLNGEANYKRNVSTGVVASTYQNWDGAFRTESVYSNNPAWILYDIITNNRYGCGSWLDSLDIDKFALYRIGRYCDEMVPSGTTGITEPRFTTNVYFSKATDVYKVLKDLSTVFRGMLYWLDGNIFPILDEPKDPVYNFSAGNVINGQFGYESSGSKTMSNQVVVSWVNPLQDYKQEALIVEDKENIIEKGRIISQTASAFGAITEGQALRYGRWKLWTAKNQTEVASFETSISAAFLAPGDVVNIQDASRGSSQLQYSGRISSASTPSITVVPLDRSVALNSTSTYELSILIEKPAVFLTQASATINSVDYTKGDLIIKSSGDYTESEGSNLIDDSGNAVTTSWQPHTRVESQPVSTGTINSSPVTSITVSSAFSEAPNSQTIWALKETNADGSTISGSKKPYKILSITEGKDTYSITAVEHYNEKFVEVDEDFVLSIDDPVFPSVKASDIVPVPRNFYGTVSNLNNSGQLKDDVTVNWEPPTVVSDATTLYQHISHYEIHHDAPGAVSPFPVDKSITTLTGLDIPEGTYVIGLRTVNTLGMKSAFTTITVTIGEKTFDNVPRGYGVALGGVLSRDIELVATTSPTAKTFKILNSSYKFASVASPLTYATITGGAAATYQQDCTTIATVNYASLATELDRALASHYIFFDASDTSDRLKLIKYHRDTTLNLEYFYDTGTGNNTNTSNFNIAGAGTVTVTANTIKVVGSGTAFTSAYAVGDIIYFSTTKAAKVVYIASDTDLRIDRLFTTNIAASSSHYPQKFKFDRTYDAAIASVRNNNGTFEMFPIQLTIDKDLNTSPRLAILQAAPTLLNFNATPILTTTYTNLVLTATAEGYANPEFKITGTGFDNSEISQTAETSFTNNGTKTYVKTLDKVDVFVATDLDFTVTIRETDDPENALKENSQTLTIPFLKDGSGSGSTGVDAKVVQLTVDDYSIIYDKDGLNPSPSGNMTLTASSQNFTDPYFKFTGDGITDETSYTDGTAASDTFTFAIPTSHFTDPKSLRVGVAEAAAATAELSFDSISITAVKPGATGVRGIDGMTFVCPNEAHVFSASETGVVSSYASSGTRIEVYEGETELVYDAVGTSNSTWKTTEAATNITVGTKTDSGNYLTVGNHSGVANGTNDSTIIYTITGKRANGTAFSTTVQQSFTKSTKGDVGNTGLQGVSGVDGDDGAGIEYIFAVTADSSTTPSAPSNSWYFDQPNSPWFDGAPSMTTSNKALWRAQRAILGNPSAGDSVSASWSGSTVVGRFADDGTDGITYYTWVKYGTSSSGAGLTNTYSAGTTTFIGHAYNKTSATESTTAGDYTWTLFEGPAGASGPAGATGSNGVTYWTWVKYGTSSSGAGLTNTYNPGTTKYIGQAYQQTSGTESTNAGDYTWSLIEGTDGAAGSPGSNGITYYTWIKYGTSSSGAGLTNTYSAGTTTFIGMAFGKLTATESTTAGDYLWTKIEGTDGTDGTDGADGTTGANGAVGKKTATGYLYYNTQQANAPSAPSNSSVTYYFSNGTMGGGVVSSGAWSLTAPTATTGTSGSKMYYIYWNATETTAGGGTASPGFGSTVYTATNFTGLVRFNGTNTLEDGLGTGNALSFGSSGTTEIDGAKITTGTIDAARLNVGSINISGFNNNSGFTNDAAANTAQTTANSANTLASSKTTAAEAATAANTANKAAGKVGGWSISSSYIQGGSGVYIASGKTAYGQTTAGFWLGNVGATPKFDIGNSSSYLRWDGSALNIKGNITLDNASSINISGFNNNSGYTDDTTANSATTTANSATTTANGATTTANAATVTANSASTAASNAQTTADGKTTLAAANAAVNVNVTSISGGVIQTGTLIAAKIESGNNAIGSSSNKFAFNGTTEYGASGISTVIGATAVNSSTAAGLFFSSGGTSALGVQTNTSGISAGLFFNSSSIGTETYRNRADLGNDLYGSVFTDDSGKYAKLATPTEAGWFQDAASTPNYVKLATGTHALYYAGAVGTFTAGHDALLADSESCEVGDILVDQGVAYASSVSDVITNVTRSTSANQKAVIGVFVQENPDHIPVPLAKEIITDIGSGPSAGVSRTHIIDPAHDSIVANKTIIAMNSVGEGQVNVCGESGDIEIGDLISSSSTTGKGMKQADDIVRSCTVGKAREAVTFATASTVKQIACIYMCG